MAKPVRCADCGFLETWAPDQGSWSPDVESRAHGDGSLCFRQVAGFDPERTLRERLCSAYIRFEPGLTAKEHFDLKEIRSAQKRDRRIYIAIGLGTIASVVVMGVLNLIFG